MKMRNYVKNGLGHVGYIEGGWFCANGYKCSLSGEYPPATSEEISVFEAEEARRAEKARIEDEKEKAILAPLGLTQDDFCRFRGVWENDGDIVVETRENGINGFSQSAVAKAGNYLINRENDEGDSTYAYYTFKKPEARDA